MLERVATWCNISARPLILVGITTNVPIRTPSVREQVLEVPVVEFVLISGSAPVAIISRVLWFGTSDSMSSRYGSRKLPTIALSPSFVEDIVDENSAKVVATLFWIRHEAYIRWALKYSVSSHLQLISEPLSESSCFVHVVGVVAS